MVHLRSLLSPLGRTSQSHYWLIVLASALAFVATWSAKNEIGAAVAVAIIVVVELVGLVATVRRLHDARWSRWWLALYLFPMTITWDLMRLRLGSWAWSVVDVSAAIRLVPVVIGLLAPSRTADNGVVVQAA